MRQGDDLRPQAGCELLIYNLHRAYLNRGDPACHAAALAVYNYARRQPWGYPQLQPGDYPSDVVKVWRKQLDAWLRSRA